MLFYTKIRFLLTILLCLVFMSFSDSEKPWIKETEKNGVTVFLRDYEGSQLKEFKAQTRVKAPLKMVVALILDFNSYPKWVFSNYNTFLIENKHNKDYIYYTIIKSPEPTKDRDLIALLKIVEQTDSKCIIKSSCLPKYINEKPNIVRVKVFTGLWELTKISENETLVTTQCHTEPGGTVPAWIMNYMITTGPYKTLFNMNEVLLEKRKKK
jgi:hypothetical protein